MIRGGTFNRKLLSETLERRNLLAVLTVTDLQDGPLDQLAGDGQLSLREAIHSINSGQVVDGIGPDSGEFGVRDQINFEPSLFNLPDREPDDPPDTLMLSAGELQISRGVEINGPHRDMFRIDANQQSRIFNISGDDDVTLSNLTLLGGKVEGTFEQQENGGAIKSTTNGVLRIFDSRITANSAVSGGGVFVQNSVVGIRRTEFTENIATSDSDLHSVYGGAIFIEMGNFSMSGASLARNLVRNQSPLAPSGGAAFAARDSAVNVDDSIVADNVHEGLEDDFDITLGTGAISILDSSSFSMNKSTVSGSRGVSTGGGVHIADSTAYIVHSDIEDNVAVDGGGVGVINSTVRLKLTDVVRNTAAPPTNGAGRGGGIFSRGSELTIDNSKIIENQQSSPDTFLHGGGAGIEIAGGTAEIDKTLISDNVAQGRGGGINSSATLTLTESTISGNVALEGAGIYSTSTLLVEGSTIVENQASPSRDEYSGIGGGISLRGSSALGGASVSWEIANTTIARNSATSDGIGKAVGGGIASHDAQGRIANSTLTENSANEGGGMHLSEGSQVEIANTIIAAQLNSSDLAIADVNEGGLAASELSLFNSLVGNGDSVGLSPSGLQPDGEGNLIGSEILPIDPLISESIGSNGRWQTYELSESSPAREAGRNSLATFLGEPLEFDQRGFKRIVEQVDIGAFESQTVIDVIIPDFDGDGDVDAFDQTILVSNWTGALSEPGDRTFQQGDVDGDGDVDSADLTKLRQHWTGAIFAQVAEDRGVGDPQATKADGLLDASASDALFADASFPESDADAQPAGPFRKPTSSFWMA